MNEFNLPVHHVYPDGSVQEVSVGKHEGRDWLVVRTDSASIVIADADHARRLAQVLLISASLMDGK